MKLKKLTFIAILLPVFAAQASKEVSDPSCTKPYKPEKFSTQTELDSFNNDVQLYQRCLYDFVTEQEKAIERHQRAANNAIDEWNNFVRGELN